MYEGEINIKKIDNGFIMKIERNFDRPRPYSSIYGVPNYQETKYYKDLDSLFKSIRELYADEVPVHLPDYISDSQRVGPDTTAGKP